LFSGYQAIESLRMNEDIIITKPDKGSAVVILNKKEYNDKTITILNDTTKFVDLGPATSNDNTAKIETQIQRRLLQLTKENLSQKPSTKPSDPLAPSDCAYTAFRKLTRKMYPYVQFCQ